MLPSIDRNSPVPVAEQLKAQVRLMIQRDLWSPGEQLPTVKALAAELELNYNTVAAAYRDLEAEGYLVQRRRAGTRVAEQPPRPAEYGLAAQLASRFARELTLHGLDVGQAVTLAVAQANLGGGRSPVRVAVLARSLLDAQRTAERAQALLGETVECVPQTPEAYRSVDYALTVVDPALTVELQASYVRRVHQIPPFERAHVPYSPDYPAGAD